MLPDKASLFLTAIEDSEYKEDKIECERIDSTLYPTLISMSVEIAFANCVLCFSTAVWNSVYGFDMSCIKKKAMMEPLVDTVDQNQIVTDSKLLKVRYYTLTITSCISFTCVANANFILFLVL